MNYSETAVAFDCDGDTLVGVVTDGAAPRRDSPGVLIIVGGPQYRAGSHRSFVLLCRALARQGIPSMRFDYRGMGDSTGDLRGFEHVSDDIAAAIDAFHRTTEGLNGVVLWGLCDGASAACFYAPADERIAGLFLVNPWVRSETGQAQTYLRSYYPDRLLQRSFWRKLLTGRIAIGRSIRDLGTSLWMVKHRSPGPEHHALATRMAAAIGPTNLPLLIVLSGRDYVAREFEARWVEDADWRPVRDRAEIEHVPDADHTFSSAEWRDTLARLTSAWVLQMTSGTESR